MSERQDPNQIDISLSLLGADSETLIKSFVDSIQQMQKTMLEIAKQQEKVLKATNANAAGVPVSGGGSWAGRLRAAVRRGGPVVGAHTEEPAPAAPEAAPTPSGGPSEPDVAAQAARQELGWGYRKMNRFTERFGRSGSYSGPRQGEEEAFGATARGAGGDEGAGGGQGGGGRGGGGASNAGDDAQYPWLRVLSNRRQQALSIPRYGNFNIQDLFQLGADSLSRSAIAPNGAVQRPRVGAVGGALDTLADISPYMVAGKRAFEGVVGTSLRPSNLQAAASDMGYARGGMDVTIPGTSIGFQVPGSQFFGPAGREGVTQAINNFKAAFSPGITKKDAQEIQSSLKAQGYSGGDLASLSGVLNDLKRDKNMGNIGSPATIAPVVDQMMRYGTNNIEGLKKSLSGLGDIARDARMRTDELNQALNQVANDAQNRGATYTQGFNTAKAFTAATNLPPQLLSEFANNGLVQANLMSSTGLLPFQQGMAPAGVQVQGIYKTMDMLEGAFAGTGHDRNIKLGNYGTLKLGGQQQVDAAVAQQMGTTVDVIGRMRRERKHNIASSDLYSAADVYDQKVSAIEHDTHLSKTAKQAREAMLNNNQSGVIGFHTMQRMMKDAGFSEKQMQSVRTLPAAQRAQRIEQIINRRADSQIKDKTTIELSAEARKWFKLHADTRKSQVNQGTLASNTYAGANGAPIPMH